MNQRKRILIAYDSSDCSKEAIKDLRRAGLPRETEALVVSVSNTAWPPEDVITDANLIRQPVARVIAAQIKIKVKEELDAALRAVEEAQQLAEQGAMQVKSNFPAWEVRAEAMTGAPAAALIRKAEDWSADLIVVGTHGRSALGRLLMGSVSQEVAAEARCSVRVGRRVLENVDSAMRLVIGVDGSLNARAAVREAARRVWPAGSLALVMAADNRQSSSPSPARSAVSTAELEQTSDEETLSPRQMLEIVEEDLRAGAGLHVSSKIIESDPANALIVAANGFDADCIFVGSSGSDGRSGRHPLGRIATAVANGAHCSVEVVRARRNSRNNWTCSLAAEAEALRPKAA